MLAQSRDLTTNRRMKSKSYLGVKRQRWCDRHNSPYLTWMMLVQGALDEAQEVMQVNVPYARIRAQEVLQMKRVWCGRRGVHWRKGRNERFHVYERLVDLCLSWMSPLPLIRNKMKVTPTRQ